MDIERLKELQIAKQVLLLNKSVLEYELAQSKDDQDFIDAVEIAVPLIDEAIARQSEEEMVTCPDCNGSGIYQEYDEYDRYYVHACGTCDGSGEVDRQQESED